MLLALDIMHLKGYIHRDIKLSNVFISSLGGLKLVLADLGFVCDVS